MSSPSPTSAPSISPELREFVGNYATKHGLNFKDAANTILMTAMRLSHFEEFRPASVAPLDEPARTKAPKVVQTARVLPVADATDTEPDAASGEMSSPTPSMRVGKVSPSRSSNPKFEVAKDMSLVSIQLGETVYTPETWRAALVQTVETLIDNGVALDPGLFRATKDRTVTTLRDGRHLYTTYSSSNMLARIRSLLSGSGISGVVKISQNGTPLEVAL